MDDTGYPTPKAQPGFIYFLRFKRPQINRREQFGTSDTVRVILWPIHRKNLTVETQIYGE